MMHPLAGRPVPETELIDTEALAEAFYALRPEGAQQQVSFGTSGHRGVPTDGTFNELHVAAIAQAICDGRSTFGATGPCLVGGDTHFVSELAIDVVLEVLAGNGVVSAVDQEGGFVPTPSLSRAILRENAKAGAVWDGILLTPSHNPPDNGGIKYNPPHGGPAEETITKWIEARANAYVAAGGAGIRRIPLEEIPDALVELYDYMGQYVAELPQIIDMEALQRAQSHVLVDALGGSGAAYWEAIRDTYGLDLTVLHTEYDPTFAFMRCDHDGKVRMDCSSRYAMQGVIDLRGDYDLAVGNDPDFDRYGVVTKQGMLSANAFLAIAAAYLFAHRDWAGKGVAKTIVVTSLVDRWAKAQDVPVYETPVGFKYFSQLLLQGKVGIAGEESAGGSFLMRDGRAWTTDKDGIVMALLALEMMATTGQTLDSLYASLTDTFGLPCMGRVDSPCSAEQKANFKQLTPDTVTQTELAGETVTAVRTAAAWGEAPIGGLRVETESGWIVARPSGTEPLCKIYGESFQNEAALEELLNAGRALLATIL